LKDRNFLSKSLAVDKGDFLKNKENYNDIEGDFDE
jgi:hypothetical protein